jgi:hypothetical protein
MLDEPRPSRTGKSLLIATSSGVRKSKLKVDGDSILYVANVFFYPSVRQRPVPGHAKKRRSKKSAASVKRRRHQEK